MRQGPSQHRVFGHHRPAHLASVAAVLSKAADNASALFHNVCFSTEHELSFGQKTYNGG